MIIRKDLLNRKYDGKTCIGFDVEIMAGDKTFVAEFHKKGINPMSLPPMLDNTWYLRFLMERDSYSDTQVFGVEYALPSATVSLELTAAIGLRYLQLKMKEEVQTKSLIDIGIGEMLVGMLGEPV